MTASQPAHPKLPGQVVLVLQGGGALGAYQLGVFEAMDASGIQPDWVIGTSIGAINAALIAGNTPAQRAQRIAQFWRHVTERPAVNVPGLPTTWNKIGAEFAVIGAGLPGFFRPNPAAWLGPLAHVGVEHASYYVAEPLRDTLASLIDVELLNAGRPRVTVGAVNACTGAMRYFDSRERRLGLDHVMSSGALPPAFPAVRVDGAPYWDGGIYSNTPVEVVLDDAPRRSSIIFSVQMWNPVGPEPQSIWQVSERQKDIQYASRTDGNIARQQQIHRLRHVINELVMRVPEPERASADVQALAAWGCQTTMRVIKLAAPRLDGDDQWKDIDFTPDGIAARRQAGFDATMQAIAARPWERPMDPTEGLSVWSPEENRIGERHN
ncbi:patatin-like phospholipase family protein [Burkholderia vietnamiensis]|uniref:patatin-like phospholipase family protein n=1 Tax=Burkholderia vietnamiensis TaxID=60552 RepID=UPI0007568D68|nr:patatin-like phospholipase family protein [Burkholderia vietnamiensis]KVE93354.1 patatin [Burkholderia vietnamiensis]MBR7916457.1 patatin-like phospholipase family protein [Burkholderia vietnamiensis]